MLLCSDDGVCPCACDYAVDASCTCRDLDGTVTVTVTKSPVNVRYNLGYIKDVNYLSYEEAVYSETCEDSAAAAIPTCNWFSYKGEIQADSQVPAALGDARTSKSPLASIVGPLIVAALQCLERHRQSQQNYIADPTLTAPKI